MRAELYRPDAPDAVVAVATWNGGRPELDVLIPTEGIESLIRLAPVVTEDPSRRRVGTHGAVVLQPADLEWFIAALETRAPPVGLRARFVPGPTEGGWDPAAQYRTFEEQVERLAGRGGGERKK
jgi:hypothetical protein